MIAAAIRHFSRVPVASAKRQLRSACIIVTAFITLALGIGQSWAATPKSSAGKASGTLTIDDKAITLKYAYAMAQPNTFDKKKLDTAVLLTSTPLPEGALRDVEDLMDATRKQKGWAFFKINSEGKPVYEVIDHPSVEGQLSMSGFTHAEFRPKKTGKDRVEGTFATSKPEEFMKYKYQIKTEFSAPLLKAKMPEPLPDARTGKALPADGGEPGKAYRAHHQAIKDKDIAALRKTAPQSQVREMSDEDLKNAIEFMAAIAPPEIKLNKGYVRGGRAVLYVEGVMDGEKQYGTVQMAAEGKAWFLEKESWSNTPPK